MKSTDVEVFPSSTLKPVSTLSVACSGAFTLEVDGTLGSENIEMSTKTGDFEPISEVGAGHEHSAATSTTLKTVRFRARLQFFACCW